MEEQSRHKTCSIGTTYTFMNQHNSPIDNVDVDYYWDNDFDSSDDPAKKMQNKRENVSMII